MRSFKLLPVYLCLFYSALAYGQSKWISMSDLEALERSGRTKEILEKAKLVKPAERTEKWNGIVTSAAKNFFDNVESDYWRWAFEIGEALIKEHPPLMKDKKFIYKLGFIGVRTYSTKGIATPYFAKALSKNDQKCTIPEVRDAIADAMTRPGFEKEKEAAKKLAFELCVETLDKPLINQMTSSQEGLQASCKRLVELKLIKGVKARKCKKLL